MAVGKVLATAAVSMAVAGSSMAFNISEAEVQRQEFNKISIQNNQLVQDYKVRLDTLKRTISSNANVLSEMNKKFQVPEITEVETNTYLDRVFWLNRESYRADFETEMMVNAAKDKLDTIQALNSEIEKANTFVEDFSKEVEEAKRGADAATVEVEEEEKEYDEIMEQVNESFDQINPIYRAE